MHLPPVLAIRCHVLDHSRFMDIDRMENERCLVGSAWSSKRDSLPTENGWAPDSCWYASFEQSLI